MIQLPDRSQPFENQPDDTLHAMCVWGEARGEGLDGKVAVAWVVLNRMRKWSKTVKQVILKPYAFSCFLATDPNRIKLFDPLRYGDQSVWDACCRAVEAARDGEVADPTNGATHYTVASLWGEDHSTKRRPAWYSKQCIDAGITKETARIGHHIFGVTA